MWRWKSPSDEFAYVRGRINIIVLPLRETVYGVYEDVLWMMVFASRLLCSYRSAGWCSGHVKVVVAWAVAEEE